MVGERSWGRGPFVLGRMGWESNLDVGRWGVGQVREVMRSIVVENLHGSADGLDAQETDACSEEPEPVCGSAHIEEYGQAVPVSA
jgi:hypothetical protein